MRLGFFITTFIISSVLASKIFNDPGEANFTGELLIEISGLDHGLLNRLLSDERLDEWSVNGEAKSGLFRVSPNDLYAVKEQLRAHPSARITIKHANVQELVDAEKHSLFSKSASSDWFESYHSLAEIEKYYHTLAEENPNLVTLVDDIGRSFEGRELFAVHFKGEAFDLADQAVDGKPDKIWIQCGSTCQYIAQQLVTGYDTDSAIRHLLDTTEVIMVPVVNPDGYEFSWTRNRLWRKNRKPFRFGTGVDLNRNFAEANWCKTGASNVPFADTYCGPNAGSEGETQAIQNYYSKYKGMVAAAIDFHSFSQLILRPNGFTPTPAPDEAHLLAASQTMSNAMQAVHGIKYSPKRSADLYPTAGSATDYFYWLPGQAFRPYSVALELRPGPESAMQGFLLDPSEIRPCVEEVFEGFMAFVRYALENPLPTSE